jgi:hypothetical protein
LFAADAGGYHDINILGGTFSQFAVGGESASWYTGNNEPAYAQLFHRIDLQAKKDTGIFYGDTTYHTSDDGTFNVTGNIILSDLASKVVNEAQVYISPSNVVPNLMVDSTYRARDTSISGSFTNVHVFPSLRSIKDGFPNSGMVGEGHHTVRFGAGRTQDGYTNTSITNLFLKDSDSPLRRVYENEDEEGFDGDVVQGCNNLVGLEPTYGTNLTIDNCTIEAGRVMIGHWQRTLLNSGGSGGYPFNQTYRAEVYAGSEILIKKGELHEKAVLDGIHRSDSSYKDFKIGVGVSHPTEDQGIQVFSEKASILLPTNIRFVADYPAGQTGATSGVNPLVKPAAIVRNLLRRP